MKRGDIAFKTIILWIIALVFLALIVVWYAGLKDKAIDIIGGI